jgi:hypothetical protein
MERTKLILRAFAELRKLFSSCLRPHGTTVLCWKAFREILYWRFYSGFTLVKHWFILEVLQKCIEKIQVLAKSDKSDC